MKRAVIGLAVIVTVLLTTAVLALSFAPAHVGNADWLPKPARGKGKHCVADTAWMRRYHMKALLHHRDEVVHDGIRTKRFDLTGCIDCHAVKGADGEPVSFASPKHFCRTCHDYAGVSIDCFECHASRPETKTTATSEAAPGSVSSADAAGLAQYLRSVQQ